MKNHLTEIGQHYITTPHGQITIQIDEKSTTLWIYDNDNFERAPQPEVIEHRQEKFLYAILANKKVKQ